MNNSILLASKSPRRRELLLQIGVNFSLIDVDVEESRRQGESPQQYVERLSLAKAEAGARINAHFPVLGADTIVVLNGAVLEKPKNKDHGIEMIMSLSGRTHSVYTAIALCEAGIEGLYKKAQQTCKSDVTFRPISREEAELYWLTGESSDKAGGYGIQGKGAVFVECLHGSYSNVVGLPLMEVQQLLRTFGIRVWAAVESMHE